MQNASRPSPAKREEEQDMTPSRDAQRIAAPRPLRGRGVWGEGRRTPEPDFLARTRSGRASPGHLALRARHFHCSLTTKLTVPDKPLPSVPVKVHSMRPFAPTAGEVLTAQLICALGAAPQLADWNTV